MSNGVVPNRFLVGRLHGCRRLPAVDAVGPPGTAAACGMAAPSGEPLFRSLTSQAVTPISERQTIYFTKEFGWMSCSDSVTGLLAR